MLKLDYRNVDAMLIGEEHGLDIESSFNETFPNPQATYKFIPTGGVNKPIAKFTIITTPKWIGSIPKVNATGINNGTNI